jgi:DNA polymerase-3 subunit alpha
MSIPEILADFPELTEENIRACRARPKVVWRWVGNCSTDGIVKVIGDCVEMGIPVLPPDINESQKDFAGVGESIRFGLAAVKGVGDAAAQAILEERAKGRFASFTDFALRMDSRLVNKRTLDALIGAGAFDSLGKNRATLAASSERVVNSAARRREEVELGQSTLFGASA